MVQPTAVIDEILDPLTESLNLDAAKALAEFKVSDAVRVRVAELAAKANEGTLTEAEQSEYETHVRYGNVLTAIKAKAQAALKNNA